MEPLIVERCEHMAKNVMALNCSNVIKYVSDLIQDAVHEKNWLHLMGNKICKAK
jgi:hypothetical protein